MPIDLGMFLLNTDVQLQVASNFFIDCFLEVHCLSVGSMITLNILHFVYSYIRINVLIF